MTGDVAAGTCKGQGGGWADHEFPQMELSSGAAARAPRPGHSRELGSGREGLSSQMMDKLSVSPPDAGKGKGDLHDLSVQQSLVTSQCRGAVSAQREDTGRTAPTDVPKTPGPGNLTTLPTP